MYVPRHFAVTDLAAIAAFVDAAAAADLVTFDGSRPVSTLLPVIWDRPPDFPGREGENGRLLGHVALANPQWQTAQPYSLALAIVHGPQAYVSPSWYESKARHGRVVPTWNYQAVHIPGSVTFHRDAEWLRDLVTRLTRRHEAAAARPWAVTDAPPEYVNGQLKAIVGVEVTITDVEAEDKLSQNRSTLDQAGVVTGLRDVPGPGPAAIAGLMAANLEAGAQPVSPPPQPSEPSGSGSASARIASLISRSCCTCSGVSRSMRERLTCSAWPGAAATSAAKPSSVSCAICPRRSVAQSIRLTQPRSSSRATACESRLLLDVDASASWVIRSARPGASDSRTRIS